MEAITRTNYDSHVLFHANTEDARHFLREIATNITGAVLNSDGEDEALYLHHSRAGSLIDAAKERGLIE